MADSSPPPTEAACSPPSETPAAAAEPAANTTSAKPAAASESEPPSVPGDPGVRPGHPPSASASAGDKPGRPAAKPVLPTQRRAAPPPSAPTGAQQEQQQPRKPPKISAANERKWQENLAALRGCIDRSTGLISYGGIDDEDVARRVKSFVKQQRTSYRKREAGEASALTDERYRLLLDCGFPFVYSGGNSGGGSGGGEPGDGAGKAQAAPKRDSSGEVKAPAPPTGSGSVPAAVATGAEPPRKRPAAGNRPSLPTKKNAAIMQQGAQQAAARQEAQVAAPDAASPSHAGAAAAATLSLPRPAYALLRGRDLNVPSSDVSVPIVRLPTVLGKDHETKERSFVGLADTTGPDEAASSRMSQYMCTIFYRDGRGGKVGIYGRGNKAVDEDDPLGGMVYKPPVEDGVPPEDPDGDDIFRLPGMADGDPVPPSGFYAVECTGRRVVVDGRALRKGQTAMLAHGSAVRIGSYCLYFLLPTLSEAARGEQRTMKVKVECVVAKTEVQQHQQPGDGVRVKEELVEAARSAQPPSKPTKPTTARPRLSPSAPTSSGPAPPPPSSSSSSPKRPRAGEDLSSLIRRLESKSDSEIMDMLATSAHSDGWDYEGQKLGSTAAMRICAAAARTAGMRDLARSNGGVTQRDILDWMSDPDNAVYNRYEPLMLRKIERKSYMMGFTKAIQRCGYVKREGVTAGRATLWYLPELPPGGDGPGSGGAEEEGVPSSGSSALGGDGEGLGGTPADGEDGATAGEAGGGGESEDIEMGGTGSNDDDDEEEADEQMKSGGGDESP